MSKCTYPNCDYPCTNLPDCQEQKPVKWSDYESDGVHHNKPSLAKQEQEYPFGIYGAEDLDKAWKSGYDNCKAQAMWTLEDVRKAWKRGYAAAKKESRAKETRKEGEMRAEIACLNNQLMFWKDQNRRLKEELKASYKKSLRDGKDYEHAPQW